MKFRISNLIKKKAETYIKEEPQPEFHKNTFEQLSTFFNTSLENGLESKRAQELLSINGKNRIKSKKPNIILKILGYLVSGFCGLLWISAVICILAWKPIGNPPDPTNLGLGILLIVVIIAQAMFAAFQDWSSMKVMKSIKNMMPSNAMVIRGGVEQKVPVEELVVGDLVLLLYGNKVPADIRIIETHDLKFDKSMLTGESEAIEGTVEMTDERYVESKNMAFMTTLITNGQGKGIVVSVGDNTMMGKISKLTNSSSQKKTTLEREITRFVIFLAVLAVTAVVILLMVWGFWIRNAYPSYIDVPTMMVNCIAVMVGFIPTGLPVAVTLSLLLMARKMASHRVLVKNLTTIETLSCVNVICSDKTGTLTQNKMFVADVYAGGHQFQTNEPGQHYENNSAFKQLICLSGLCNNAHFAEDTNELKNSELPVDQRKINGDATDSALLKLSAHHIEQHKLQDAYDILCEIPFNSRNKWMMKSVRPKHLGEHNLLFGETLTTDTSVCMFLKGAPDKLLIKCTKIIQEDGSERELDNQKKLEIIAIQNEWCMKGQRVLLLCKRNFSHEESSEFLLTSSKDMEMLVEETRDFSLVGMVGIIDPPREGISDVINQCRGAGIRVVMVTGDYALTAAAIAKDIGTYSNLEFDTILKLKDKKEDENTNNNNLANIQTKKYRSLLINGPEFDLINDEEWRLITKYDEIVFARTTPEQKLKIVKEFQRDKYVVAVTGDGVNDAPALKNADIGIAMGGGSEVAMEASQVVLLDNSFHSILVAIENGRLVFENLRKVILYLLPAGSIGELCPILTNIFLGVPLPLSAFLMICICILTDLFPALAMMLEKPEKDLLKKAPRSKNEHLVNWRLIIQAYFFLGLIETFFSHLAYFLYMQWYGGFKASEILLIFSKWQDGYKGYTNDQLLNFVYTGQTICFIALVIMQSFGNVFASRTNYRSLFQRPPFLKKSRNLWLFLGIFITLVLMILIVFLPFCNSIFNTRMPPAEFFFLPLAFALFIIVADELRKLAVRKNFLCFARIAW